MEKVMIQPWKTMLKVTWVHYTKMAIWWHFRKIWQSKACADTSILICIGNILLTTKKAPILTTTKTSQLPSTFFVFLKKRLLTNYYFKARNGAVSVFDPLCNFGVTKSFSDKPILKVDWLLFHDIDEVEHSIVIYQSIRKQ